ncbi:hypothetical protein AVEN_232247-1 [Araneus ventricosus]|uniref:Peptidase A2 domain-containing protein n=1 Tax=Araneus ventricosus TaxID=182803 RepID=A0A4Y2J6J0_ARAVE|nr:hypothetical protein AVEN_232247-1 [Araneus ventricosus]
MLVDTGANVTLVSTDLAQKLKGNFIYTAPNISLKTATGEKAEIHGKLDATIECGSRKFQHKIYVADITDPCILGLDFLQNFNFMLDLEKNEIRTGGEEIPLFSASAEDSKLCSVLAKEYAVTDFPSQVSHKGVLVAATLVDLKKEAIPVRVLNLDHEPKTIDKGAVIATCEPVVDIVARPQGFSESLRLPSILENLEGLNEEQRTAVKELLQEFQNLFSTSDSDVGRCNMTHHRINTGNHPPIKQYPRRLPLAKKEEAERLVKEMVRENDTDQKYQVLGITSRTRLITTLFVFGPVILYELDKKYQLESVPRCECFAFSVELMMLCADGLGFEVIDGWVGEEEREIFVVIGRVD